MNIENVLWGVLAIEAVVVVITGIWLWFNFPSDLR